MNAREVATDLSTGLQDRMLLDLVKNGTSTRSVATDAVNGRLRLPARGSASALDGMSDRDRRDVAYELDRMLAARVHRLVR